MGSNRASLTIRSSQKEGKIRDRGVEIMTWNIPEAEEILGVVSQFMHQPQEEHMHTALRIVRYVKGITNNGVFLKKGEHLEVDGYTDADWASNPIDRLSTGGYFTFVGGNLVTWRSKKQKVVALSSAEQNSEASRVGSWRSCG
ncbi:secreted RxLR effector protein 161-like [Salvia hispanica]|uniref:secreted RxLR effector protein 161-like n=1 Tax=Salvia hispanica TaxID=49212 RepID=UPI0020094B8D|nr:secreted RxLR effector protein 161-like [Salvia hispanica]